MPRPGDSVGAGIARGLPAQGDWRNPTLSWEKARQLTGRPEREWSFALFTERAWVLSGRLRPFFYEPLGSWDSTIYAIWLGHEFRSRHSSPFVALGFSYFDRCYRAKDGRLTLPSAGEPFRGRHQVEAVGMRDDSILFSNSWGQDWGAGGYGLMPREYFEKYADTIMVRWVADSGPSPATFDALRSSMGRRQRTTIDDFRAHWDTPNPMASTNHLVGGAMYTMARWTVESLDNWEPVWVLELSNPVRTVGCAHVHSSVVDGQAVIKELFIDPRLRRRGLGSLLLSEACEVAVEHGYGAAVAWIDEADDQPPFAQNTRAFFAAHGWRWAVADAVRPVLKAMARKELA
jgi:GNAT superfamily N-acetyltransferase